MRIGASFPDRACRTRIRRKPNASHGTPTRSPTNWVTASPSYAGPQFHGRALMGGSDRAIRRRDDMQIGTAHGAGQKLQLTQLVCFRFGRRHRDGVLSGVRNRSNRIARMVRSAPRNIGRISQTKSLEQSEGLHIGNAAGIRQRGQLGQRNFDYSDCFVFGPPPRHLRQCDRPRNRTPVNNSDRSV